MHKLNKVREKHLKCLYITEGGKDTASKTENWLWVQISEE